MVKAASIGIHSTIYIKTTLFTENFDEGRRQKPPKIILIIVFLICFISHQELRNLRNGNLHLFLDSQLILSNQEDNSMVSLALKRHKRIN